MPSATTLLSAVTSTGEGSAKDLKRLIDKHVMQIDITGAPSAVTVLLEGSLDGNDYGIIGTHAMTAADLTNTTAIVFDSDSPCLHVRANLSILTAGTAPTVTVLYEGISTGEPKTTKKGVF